MNRRIAYALTACLAVGCGRAAPQHTTTTPAADPATTGTISGAVRDRASGDTLSFATVNATLTDAVQISAENTETTSARGEFQIPGLQPGKYRVTVYYSNVSVMWQEVEVKAGVDMPLQIDISLEESAEPYEATTAPSDAPTQAPNKSKSKRGIIAGSVIDEKTGEQLEGAVVAATSPHMSDAQLAVTNETGAYRILGLPPGKYTISVYYRLIDYGYIEVQRNNVEVSGGETTTVPLKLDTNVKAGSQ